MTPAPESAGPDGLVRKAYHQDSVLLAANLLREARRQRELPDVPVPPVCLLDPDGDIAAHLRANGLGHPHPGWACYHTQMWVTELDGRQIGVVGHAVGAPFAVLVAEQLAVSGADLVISITSAGQLWPVADPPYFVLVDRALRDEGTSGHYVPPATWARVPGHLREALEPLLPGLPEPLVLGDAWTTDAPYRETPAAIDAARGLGAGCVEMESAALYSYATALGRDVICLAHVTNTMAVTDDDFEKGADDGVAAALTLTSALLHALRPEHTRPPAGTSATGPRVK